jgi:hypothetical protein
MWKSGIIIPSSLTTEIWTAGVPDRLVVKEIRNKYVT